MIQTNEFRKNLKIEYEEPLGDCGMPVRKAR